VEVSQLYTLDRIASLTDVFAAIGGAVAGCLLAQPFTGATDLARSFAGPSGMLDAAELPVLAALLAAIVIAAWWPLDPTLDVSTLAGRWRAFRSDAWQVDRPVMISQALLYACLTLVIATCAARLQTLSAAIVAAVAATGVAVAVDAGQLVMGARSIGLAAVASQLAGVTAGGVAFAALRRSR
jgi:VanZ family protein